MYNSIGFYNSKIVQFFILVNLQSVKCSILPNFNFQEAITTANFLYLNGRFLQSSNSVQLLHTLLMLL